MPRDKPRAKNDATMGLVRPCAKIAGDRRRAVVLKPSAAIYHAARRDCNAALRAAMTARNAVGEQALRRARLAEGVGFEPTRACALPVFKTGAFNHSAIPPRRAPAGAMG